MGLRARTRRSGQIESRRSIAAFEEFRMQGIANAYLRVCSALAWLRSPLLLAIRLYWGWQFAQDGWGKLTHLSRVTEFFASLNLPAPGATAFFVASVEFI